MPTGDKEERNRSGKRLDGRGLSLNGGWVMEVSLQEQGEESEAPR